MFSFLPIHTGSPEISASSSGLWLAVFFLLVSQPGMVGGAGAGIGAAIDDPDPSSRIGVEFTTVGDVSGSGDLGGTRDELTVESRVYGAVLDWNLKPVYLESSIDGSDSSTESSILLDRQKKRSLDVRANWILGDWLRPYGGYQGARSQHVLKDFLFGFTTESIRKRDAFFAGLTVLMFAESPVRPFAGGAFFREKMTVIELETGAEELREVYDLDSGFIEVGLIGGAKPGEAGFRLVLGTNRKHSPKEVGENYDLLAATRRGNSLEIEYGFEDADSILLGYESLENELELSGLSRELEDELSITFTMILNGTWSLTIARIESRTITYYTGADPVQVSVYDDTTTTLAVGVDW